MARPRVKVEFVLHINHATGDLKLLSVDEFRRGKRAADIVPLCTTRCRVKRPGERGWFGAVVNPAVLKARQDWEAVHVNEMLIWVDVADIFDVFQAPNN